MAGPPAQDADPSALGRARAAHILTSYATEPDDPGLGAGPRVYTSMGTLHHPPRDRAFERRRGLSVRVEGCPREAVERFVTVTVTKP